MSYAPERICLPPIEDGAAIDEWLVPSLYSPPISEMIPADWTEYVLAEPMEQRIKEFEAELARTNECLDRNGAIASDAIAELEAENAEMLQELKHCSVFIRTREKMHPDGIALFDELVERVDA